MNFDDDKAKELQGSFELFIECIIKYINSYFDRDRELFQKLLVFDCQSNDFLKWECFMDVINLIKIHGLDTDELYNEYCEIKFMYGDMKNQNVKVNEQIKLYISSKSVYNPKSIINSDQIQCDINDDDDDGLVSDGARSNEYIQSDQLSSYLLNIKPNSAPNMKLVFAYVFSIPCSNAFVETKFSHMNHFWSDYRNRIDIELVEAELQIRKNSNIPCTHFYDFLLTQEELLKKIGSNEKFIRKKRLLDK